MGTKGNFIFLFFPCVLYEYGPWIMFIELGGLKIILLLKIAFESVYLMFV